MDTAAIDVIRKPTDTAMPLKYIDIGHEVNWIRGRRGTSTRKMFVSIGNVPWKVRVKLECSGFSLKAFRVNYDLKRGAVGRGD